MNTDRYGDPLFPIGEMVEIRNSWQCSDGIGNFRIKVPQFGIVIDHQKFGGCMYNCIFLQEQQRYAQLLTSEIKSRNQEE